MKSLSKFGRTTPLSPPQTRIRALTLHRPWSHILGRHYPPDFVPPKYFTHRMIEHRSWNPERRGLKPGDWIVLHAGKTTRLTNSNDTFSGGLGINLPTTGWGDAGELTCLLRYQRFATSRRQIPPNQYRWYQDDSAWVFDDFIKLDPPILHGNGAQGLWYPPPATQNLLLTAIAQHTPTTDNS